MPDPRTTARARRLRQMANTPEQKAWQTLRKLRGLGFPVKRQVPIGAYIVDFAIHRVRLVIETDGSIHAREDIARRDPARQREIEALGWHVLRFSDAQAMDADFLWGRVAEYLGL